MFLFKIFFFFRFLVFILQLFLSENMFVYPFTTCSFPKICLFTLLQQVPFQKYFYSGFLFLFSNCSFPKICLLTLLQHVPFQKYFSCFQLGAIRLVPCSPVVPCIIFLHDLECDNWKFQRNILRKLKYLNIKISKITV